MTIEKAMRTPNAQFELRHLEQLQPSVFEQVTIGTSEDDVYYVTLSDDTIIENPMVAMIRFAATSAIPFQTTLKTLS